MVVAIAIENKVVARSCNPMTTRLKTDIAARADIILTSRICLALLAKDTPAITFEIPDEL